MIIFLINKLVINNPKMALTLLTLHYELIL